MSKVNQLKTLYEEVPYGLFVEIIDCIWTVQGSDVIWNTDDNIEDLTNGDGETYYSELDTDFTNYEDYLVAIINNGCGDNLTGFFHKDKRVEIDY